MRSRWKAEVQSHHLLDWSACQCHLAVSWLLWKWSPHCSCKYKVWLHGVWIPFPSFKGKRSCLVAVRLWISVFPLWINKIFNSIWFCFMQKIPYMLDLHMESFHRFWVFLSHRLFEGKRMGGCVHPDFIFSSLQMEFEAFLVEQHFDIGRSNWP